jgi:hypothetical protein
MCVDTVTGDEVDGNIMCPSSAGMKACELQCPHSDSSGSTGTTGSYMLNDFCLGPGISMAMNGFETTSKSTAAETECVIFLFPTWVLDSSVKFAFACIGTFLTGVLIHALSKLRADIIKIPLFSTTSFPIKRGLLVIVYGLQITLSYLIMLVAMTYNTELFIMVVLGLTCGYALFSPDFHVNSNNAKYMVIPSASSDPCCPQEESYSVDMNTSLFQKNTQ